MPKQPKVPKRAEWESFMEGFLPPGGMREISSRLARNPEFLKAIEAAFREIKPAKLAESELRVPVEGGEVHESFGWSTGGEVALVGPAAAVAAIAVAVIPLAVGPGTFGPPPGTGTGTGGTETGGTETGGTETGGTETGGTETGGTETGGTETGGTETGGTETGGTETGGTETGGTEQSTGTGTGGTEQSTGTGTGGTEQSTGTDETGTDSTGTDGTGTDEGSRLSRLIDEVASLTAILQDEARAGTVRRVDILRLQRVLQSLRKFEV